MHATTLATWFNSAHATDLLGLYGGVGYEYGVWVCGVWVEPVVYEMRAPLTLREYI